MTLRIDIEWLDAPGVGDEVLAATWARICIAVSISANENLCLSRALDIRTEQIRDGIYGSCFPLARWFVNCYWSLMCESRVTPEIASGRVHGAIPKLRPWVQRHCLLNAREGFSLPDLTIARDGENIVLVQFPDNQRKKASERPVSFVTNCTIRLRPSEIDNAIAKFVDSIIEKTRSLEAPEVVALRNDWNAILASKSEESMLCEIAGRLGLDPYDSAELSDSIVEYIESNILNLEESIRSDVVDTSAGYSQLVENFEWLKSELDDAIFQFSSRKVAPIAIEINSAHFVGYQRAKEFRSNIGLRDISDISIPALSQRAQFPMGNERVPKVQMPIAMDAVIMVKAGSEAPEIIASDIGYSSKVFRWARALYFWEFCDLSPARLITKSHARPQRESRAFAAELLAPAEALRRRISSAVVGPEIMNTLAQEFNVSPFVIEHQITNHQLAVLVAE